MQDLRRVQDLRYHYDPVGNITRIRDLAQQGVYFDNAYADPTQSFTYDPLYRLIAAPQCQRSCRLHREPPRGART